MKVFVTLRQVFVPLLKNSVISQRCARILGGIGIYESYQVPWQQKLPRQLAQSKKIQTKAPWSLIVFMRGWNTTHLCDDYFINHGIRIAMNQPVWWKVRFFFFVAQLAWNVWGIPYLQVIVCPWKIGTAFQPKRELHRLPINHHFSMGVCVSLEPNLKLPIQLNMLLSFFWAESKGGFV